MRRELCIFVKFISVVWESGMCFSQVIVGVIEGRFKKVDDRIKTFQSQASTQQGGLFNLLSLITQGMNLFFMSNICKPMCTSSPSFFFFFKIPHVASHCAGDIFPVYIH